MLALLYAGPGSAVCRRPDGGLEVVPEYRATAPVLTQDELLEEGVEALLDLVA
ncbi:hypothetical protein F4561_002705 [Lipingzhangella halophila]|uniref:Uncharacterized protein n=1 Tax=Lipingzhangella halophila TaxID=1783352 RepID=A0A7W7RH48_9ACTN|nr:hypothetical protein [Lipingzhangella halophila]MBB4931885.1 hypothetical protein [Lipingzhangella halophila]